MLVTTRRRLGVTPDTTHVTLHPLALDDAVDLMASQLGRIRVDEDRAGAMAVARMCDGLPLALRIAGGRLTIRAGLSLSTLAEMMELNPLDGLELGDLSMRQHLAHDYQVVAGEDAVARRVFPLLGRLAAEETLTVQQAAERLGEDRSRVFRALERLVDAQLAETPESGHYRAPGLLRHFAAELQLVAG